jgi:glycerophosphoryl diester phosphodiesterase
MSDLAWLTARPIAHRGYHDMNRTVFENTATAFARAVDAGFAIECDLQFAADGVPVVFHDDTLDRLTPIKGPVRDKLSGELRQLAIGGAANLTRDRIQTLPEMLQQVAGRVPLIIELKGKAGDDDGFAGAVLDALEAYEGSVALMSFDAWLLKDLKALDCPWPVGLTAEGTRPETFFAHEDALRPGLDFVSYNVHHLPNPFIAGLRDKGMPVITWTVRDMAAVAVTRAHADQMTFEGFDPRD